MYGGSGLYLSGLINCPGGVVAGGGTVSCGVVSASSSVYSSGNFHLNSDQAIYFEATNVVAVYYSSPNGSFYITHLVQSGVGYKCKQGMYGAYSNNFNYFWNNTNMEQWVDATNTGTVYTISDYRTRKVFRFFFPGVMG